MNSTQIEINFYNISGSLSNFHTDIYLYTGICPVQLGSVKIIFLEGTFIIRLYHFERTNDI